MKNAIYELLRSSYPYAEYYPGPGRWEEGWASPGVVILDEMEKVIPGGLEVCHGENLM